MNLLREPFYIHSSNQMYRVLAGGTTALSQITTDINRTRRGQQKCTDFYYVIQRDIAFPGRVLLRHPLTPALVF